MKCAWCGESQSETIENELMYQVAIRRFGKPYDNEWHGTHIGSLDVCETCYRSECRSISADERLR